MNEQMNNEEVNKGDQAVEATADKLETLVTDAQSSGGVKAKVGAAFADDPDFVRKLKPTLIAARIKGGALKEESPTDDAPVAPSGPQMSRPATPGQRSRGLSPWAVLGVAFVAGYVLAKAIDWRGHAHPRR
jgi:hypothetical protein